VKRSRKWQSWCCYGKIRWQIVTLLFIVLNSSLAYSQHKPKDHDSLKVYKKIKRFAEKRRVTKWLYEAVFRNPEPKEYPSDPVTHNANKQVNPYIKNEKKIIRKVNITVLDPFGSDFTDTCCKRLNHMERFGNGLHFRTRHWIIANRLLFKKNDTINPLALSESERLLRTSGYINDAKIFITKTNQPDTVDVNVIVIDRWALSMPAEVTSNSANGRFRNQNLFGLGQQYEQYVGFKKPNRFDITGLYNIPNIKHTFISSQIGYAIHPGERVVYTNFNRPFFSPLVNWSWGANFSNYWAYYHYTDSIDSVPGKADVSLFNYDLYASRSFKLSNRKTFFDQSTNIIVGARHYSAVYWERPASDIDPKRSYPNTSAVIGNVGFAVQQYYKDKYVYRFGANEDVPEGFIAQLVYGVEKQEYKKYRYYLGTEIARAKHFNFGYLTATLAYGVFFNKSLSNDITTNFNLYYFSNLSRSGRWFFRQFFNYKCVNGINKLESQSIKIESEDMYGYQSQELRGKTKMIFNSETVAYAPYNLIGFRFAPVFQAGFGVVGDPVDPIQKSRLYQAYTLGIMVRNENLLNSTFQFSIGLYPFLPTTGESKFIFNPVTSFTLRVRAFNVSIPQFVSYH
jgi:hypothetical protein